VNLLSSHHDFGQPRLPGSKDQALIIEKKSNEQIKSLIISDIRPDKDIRQAYQA